VRFLASTNRGIESVAVEEIRSLVGGSPAVHHPGMVAFEADETPHPRRGRLEVSLLVIE
jgi:23S rRNA G2445 N2-methylase RlmL